MTTKKHLRHLLLVPFAAVLLAHFACKPSPTTPSFKDSFLGAGAVATDTPLPAGTFSPTPTSTLVSGTHAFVKQWGSSGTGPAQFNNPHGIAVDDSLNVYVADYTNNRVKVFDTNGVPVTNWSCPYPQGIGVNNTGDVYTAQQMDDSLQHYVKNVGISTTGFSSCSGGSFKVKGPVGVACDDSGNIYVAAYFSDTSNGIAFPVAVIYTWGGVCDFKFEEAMTPPDHFYPQGIAVDHGGNWLYMVDSGYHRIYRMDLSIVPPTGGPYPYTTAGSQGVGDLQFNFPHGVAVDKNGLVYVVDSSNHRVQVLSADLTTMISQFGSMGTGPGQFINPWGVAVDKNGYIYVTDGDNHRVQKFAP